MSKYSIYVGRVRKQMRIPQVNSVIPDYNKYSSSELADELYRLKLLKYHYGYLESTIVELRQMHKWVYEHCDKAFVVQYTQLLIRVTFYRRLRTCSIKKVIKALSNNI